MFKRVEYNTAIQEVYKDREPPFDLSKRKLAFDYACVRAKERFEDIGVALKKNREVARIRNECKFSLFFRNSATVLVRIFQAIALFFRFSVGLIIPEATICSLRTIPKRQDTPHPTFYDLKTETSNPSLSD